MLSILRFIREPQKGQNHRDFYVRLFLPEAEKCVQFCNYSEDMGNPAMGSVYLVFATPQCQFPEANFEKL